MNRQTALIALIPLAGCQLIQDVRSAIDGLTNPVVVVGAVAVAELGERDPDADPPGLSAQIYLLDAREAVTADASPVRGVDAFISGCGEEVQLNEGADGLYSYSPPGALDACAGPFTITVDADDPPTLEVAMPGPINFDAPEQWSANQSLIVDVDGMGYSQALVVVTRGDGTVTYSNEPQTGQEYYQFLTGRDEIDTIEIPGSAFTEDAVFAVSITALRRAEQSGFENVNRALSALAGGRSIGFGLTTRDRPNGGGGADDDTDTDDDTDVE